MAVIQTNSTGTGQRYLDETNSDKTIEISPGTWPIDNLDRSNSRDLYQSVPDWPVDTLELIARGLDAARGFLKSSANKMKKHVSLGKINPPAQNK